MRVEQKRWTQSTGWDRSLEGPSNKEFQLAFVFGSTALLKEKDRVAEIARAYPASYLFGCSTAGEIYGTQVADESLTVTAVHFDHTRIEGTSAKIGAAAESFRVGEELAKQLKTQELVHVLVLSDGLSINGSDLVRGLTANLPPNVAVTGGLSGDGARFKETLVLAGKTPETGTIGIVGLYGSRLQVGYSSLGGWDPFGPERIITRSEANVLYELDGKSALGLYKKYLGDQAAGLPGTGLLFPLSLRMDEKETAVVRTILSVSEKDQSMTFAGSVPEGAKARLMKANFDRLIEGAAGAAQSSISVVKNSPELALLISCVGRKLILKQRIEEEVEGVREILGPKTALTGFYSYGEISPFTPGAKCELHNQTMTITTLSEN